MGAAQVSDSVEHISLLCSQKVAIVYFIKGDNAVLEKVMAILHLSQGRTDWALDSISVHLAASLHARTRSEPTPRGV